MVLRVVRSVPSCILHAMCYLRLMFVSSSSISIQGSASKAATQKLPYMVMIIVFWALLCIMRWNNREFIRPRYALREYNYTVSLKKWLEM